MTLRVSIAAAGIALLSSAGVAWADGDAAAGEKIFNVKCKICHQIGEGAKNMVGPEQNGLVGRKAGSVAGYNYSEANKNSGITWTEDELDKYLKDPKGVVPGTKMVFAGLPKEEDRKDIIAFLAQFNADGKKK